MRIIAKRILKDFWIIHPAAEFPLLDWFSKVKQSVWQSPNDLKKTFAHASIIANNRVVFNIKGNDFRLIADVDYEYQLVFIIWIGSHKEYDKIDAKNIKYNG